jgi:hypothetical protein
MVPTAASAANRAVMLTAVLYDDNSAATEH